eukprot:tig00001368_g8405.t1
MEPGPAASPRRKPFNVKLAFYENGASFHQTRLSQLSGDEQDVRQAARAAATALDATGTPPRAPSTSRSWKRRVVQKAVGARRQSIERSQSKVREIEIEDSNRMFESRTALRRSNLVAAVSALAALLVVLVQQEIFYHAKEQTSATEAMKTAICALTAVALCAVVFSYRAWVEIRILRNRALPTDNLWTLGLVPYLAVEVLVLLLQPYPFIRDVTVRMGTTKCQDVPLTDLAGVFMWLRVYLLARVYQDHYWKHQMNYFYSALNGVELDMQFTLKSALQQSPFLLVAFFFLLSFFAGSHVMWVLERNCPFSQVTSFGDSMWLMFVSMTTVGYGDIVPVSQYTRIVITVVILAGLSVTALYQTVVINYLQLTALERRFSELVSRSRWRNRLRNEAAAAIQKVWRARRDARKKNTRVVGRVLSAMRLLRPRTSAARAGAEQAGARGADPSALAFPPRAPRSRPAPRPRSHPGQPRAGPRRRPAGLGAGGGGCGGRGAVGGGPGGAAAAAAGGAAAAGDPEARERQTALEPDTGALILAIRDDLASLRAALALGLPHPARARPRPGPRPGPAPAPAPAPSPPLPSSRSRRGAPPPLLSARSTWRRAPPPPSIPRLLRRLPPPPAPAPNAHAHAHAAARPSRHTSAVGMIRSGSFQCAPAPRAPPAPPRPAAARLTRGGVGGRCTRRARGRARRTSSPSSTSSPPATSPRAGPRPAPPGPGALPPGPAPGPSPGGDEGAGGGSTEARLEALEASSARVEHLLRALVSGLSALRGAGNLAPDRSRDREPSLPEKDELEFEADPHLSLGPSLP